MKYIPQNLTESATFRSAWHLRNLGEVLHGPGVFPASWGFWQPSAGRLQAGIFCWSFFSQGEGFSDPVPSTSTEWQRKKCKSQTEYDIWLTYYTDDWRCSAIHFWWKGSIDLYFPSSGIRGLKPLICLPSCIPFTSPLLTYLLGRVGMSFKRKAPNVGSILYLMQPVIAWHTLFSVHVCWCSCSDQLRGSTLADRRSDPPRLGANRSNRWVWGQSEDCIWAQTWNILEASWLKVWKAVGPTVAPRPTGYQ